MRLIQVIGVDQSPTAQEAADGIYALNCMLDAWSIERLMVYQVQQAGHVWLSGNASRTIGSGGDFNAARPIRIEPKGTFFRTSSNYDYPVGVYPRSDYDNIVQKSAGGSIPDHLFYDDNFPTRTLYAYPVPSETLTLYLNTWKALQQFTALTTSLSLPPGYQGAIEYNLAVWMAPEFGAAAKAAARDIAGQASLLKQAIKGVAKPDLVARVDGALTGGRPSRIESDS